MKSVFYLITIFLMTFSFPKILFSQSGILHHSGEAYYCMLTKDSLYNAAEYKKAITFHLSEMEQKNDLTGQNLYIIAKCYAMLEMPDSAFYYLNNYIDNSNKDYRYVFIDEDLEILRKDKKEWFRISNKIEDIFINNLDATANKEYAYELFQLGIEDFLYRHTDLICIRHEKPKPIQIRKKQEKIRKDFDKLVRKYGFPSPSTVGIEATWFAFDIMYPVNEEKLYLMVKKAFNEGDYLPVHYAWITDRWLMQNEKLQLFGTQFSAELNSEGKRATILMPVEDFKNLNKRRAEIGLQTIEKDAKIINGTIPQEYYVE
ncbi:MAG: hypothetical protein PHW83_11810 [Bacteroidales bacterium]|nr:hypothetical protein [Bacteroidales bacterium]